MSKVAALLASTLGLVLAFMLFPAAKNWVLDTFYSRTYNGQVIPASGLAMNPRSSDPVNPENGYQDLRRIYGALVQFRAKHHRMPNNPWELLEAGKRGEVDLDRSDYINPDVLKSDNQTLQANVKKLEDVDVNASYGFDWLANLPDGTKKPAFPPAEKPVVWASTSVYSRENGKVFPGYRYRFQPSGFVLKLYSNGEIRKVEPKDRFVVRDADGSWRPIDLGVEKPNGRTVIAETELYARLEKGTAFGKQP